MKCSIADLIINLQPDPWTERQAQKYAIEDDVDFDFIVKPRTLEDYNSRVRNYDFEPYQYVTCGNSFYRGLLDYNGMMLHSSAVVVDGKAYLFSASCGTGKSTHTGKWLELFGERAFILNDDKPAIRVLDDGIYAYGTPWSGKVDLSVNTKAKLQGICFLERDTVNHIEPMEKGMAFIRMCHAALPALSKENTIKQLNIINKIISNVPIYSMGCTPTVDAAKMAYDTMSKNGSL